MRADTAEAPPPSPTPPPSGGARPLGVAARGAEASPPPRGESRGVEGAVLGGGTLAPSCRWLTVSAVPPGGGCGGRTIGGEGMSTWTSLRPEPGRDAGTSVRYRAVDDSPAAWYALEFAVVELSGGGRAVVSTHRGLADSHGVCGWLEVFEGATVRTSLPFGTTVGAGLELALFSAGRDCPGSVTDRSHRQSVAKGSRTALGILS